METTRRIRRWPWLVGLALFALLAIPGPHPATADDIAVILPLEVPRLASEIEVDGLLDESAWQRALTIPLRYETRPGENVAPPVETEGLLLYDDAGLYIAFRAKDPSPRQIRAHLSDRDTAWSDDYVGVVLDTFNDERRAFEFFVNPLGVQMDVLRDDVNRRANSSWDAIWHSAGRITEDGYVVEVAIPFHSLRFPSGAQAQTWGVDMLRMYPRGQRHRISSQPLDRDKSCYLCQISKIEGFENLTPGRNLEFVPTLVSSRTDARGEDSGGSLAEGDLESEVGLTATWGVTPNLTLMGTLNPDFSQVEADVAQLDVNNQFALFFPERRPFFLEGADFFNTPMRAVFSRNVADPDWGLKLTGKVGANGLGVFAAEDAITNLVFPGSQGSDSDSFDFPTTDTVLRYRRDLGKSSALGALVTSRAGDDYSNLVSGLDGSFRFKESNTVSVQYLASQTEYPTEIIDEFEQPSGSFSDAAFRARFNHNSRNWNAFAHYEDVGRDFRADMGFMPRVDYRLALGGAERIWWGEDENWWTQIRFGGDVDRTEDQSGRVLEQESQVWTLVSGPMQSWLWATVGTRDRFFDGVEFNGERFVDTWFEIQPSGEFYFGAWVRFGDDIDFANTRPAERFSFEPRIRYNVGKHLRINLSHELRTLDVDGGELFEANLTQLRMVYQFNIRTFARLITQYTDITRDPTLYVDEVESQSETLFNQLLFAYKLNPRTVAFLGYSDTRVGNASTSLEQDDRSIFVKIGYSWQL